MQIKNDKDIIMLLRVIKQVITPHLSTWSMRRLLQQQ